MSFEMLKSKNRFTIDTYTKEGTRLRQRYISADKAEDLIPVGITDHNLSFISRVEISSVGKDSGNK